MSTEVTEEHILAIVVPRFETKELAEAWYREEALPGYSRRTAADLVRAGRGDEVLEYIQSVDAGIFS